MMGDNRDASLDSRYFGFVPETHIMGSPMFTWLSLEGSFTDNNSSYQANGWRIRWDRMFKATNTGEANKNLLLVGSSHPDGYFLRMGLHHEVC